MRLTVRHLKRIIKEAVNEAHDDMVSGPIHPGDNRGQIHYTSKSKPRSREAQIVDFIEDIHYEFGNVGEEGGEMSWKEVMDFARKKGVKTTPAEIERVFLDSEELDDSLRWIMHVTDNGFDFEDPMAL